MKVVSRWTTWSSSTAAKETAHGLPRYSLAVSKSTATQESITRYHRGSNIVITVSSLVRNIDQDSVGRHRPG
jgi:hypothetical protein